MRYMLDTDTCIYFLKRNENVVRRIGAVAASDLAISCINLAELLYGAYTSEHVDKNLERVRFIESTIAVLGMERKSIETYAMIKASLKKRGNLIDDMDIMIASVALSNELILVTNNEKHFSRIPNIRIENWVRA